MPDQSDALTRLVQKHVGQGRLTVRAFEERAVDPLTGRRVSKSTAGNLIKGHQIKVTPEVLRAIAAGLGVDVSVVRAAAIRQYIGVEMSTVDTDSADDAVVQVVHQLGATDEELARARRALDDSGAEPDGR